MSKRPVVSGSRDYFVTPMFSFNPSERKVKKLHDDLVLSGKGLGFGEHLSVNNFKPPFIYGTSISDFKNEKGTENLQNKNTRPTIARMFDNVSYNVCCDHIEDDGNRQFIEKFLRIDLETARKLEEKTLGQSTNDSWFTQRKKRLTASNFGSIINRGEHIQPKSIFNPFMT